MPKRLGYVSFTIKYAVDLDNESMVEYAQERIYEDLSTLIKFNEYMECDYIEDPTLTEDDLLDDPMAGEEDNGSF